MSFTVYKSSAGSGKTFTLVKEYINLVLADPNRYRHILAITFTNKAANEMKQRILGSLAEIADHKNHMGSSAVSIMLPDIGKKTGLQTEVLIENASKVLTLILHNYTDFAVSTIDSFMHRVIRSFAFDLHIPLDFEVEMESDALLNKMVDVLISRAGTEEKLTRFLVEFTRIKADDEKNWNIELDIFKIAELLLKEDSNRYLNKLNSLTLEDFTKIIRILQDHVFSFESRIKNTGNEALELIRSQGLQQGDFSHGRSGIGKYFQNLAEGIVDKLEPNSYVRKTIEENKWTSYSAKPDVIQKIDAISEKLSRLYTEIQDFIQKNLSLYILYADILQNIYPLAILHEIDTILNEYKQENGILLISEFNKRIAEIVLHEPVPFIYERVGEKYGYFLIDEFQDTSVLQWQNLLPLIENALAVNNFTMIVGDGKQAIYRWRSGEVEQFAALPDIYNMPDDPVNKQRQSMLKRNYQPHVLNSNFRSANEIVNFNNRFFTMVSNFLDESKKGIYEDVIQHPGSKKTGGYVEFNFYDKQLSELNFEEYNIHEIRVRINDSVSRGYRYQDIAVLCRSNNNAATIATSLLEAGIPVVSAESLLLTNSKNVRLVIASVKTLINKKDHVSKTDVIRWVENNKESPDLHTAMKEAGLFLSLNKETDFTDNFFNYLEKNGISCDPSKLLTLPLYELCEELIRLFGLAEKQDPYLQFLLDAVLDQSTDPTLDASAFIDWWEEKKEKLSVIVPEGLDAVHVMTIHKAKGLEFPVVIYPFANNRINKTKNLLWVDMNDDKLAELPAALISTTSIMGNTQFGDLIAEEESKSLLDLVNILYVVLTRPTDELYIITAMPPANPTQTATLPVFFYQFLLQNEEWETGKMLYHFGQKTKKIIQAKQAQRQWKSEAWISHDWVDRIRISRQAPKYLNTETDTDKTKWGNLIHEILADITTKDDVNPVLEVYRQQGIINLTDQQQLLEILLDFINHPEIRPFFSPSGEVINEVEILLPNGKIYRPDRVIVEKEAIIVIDFKTGVYSEKHEEQVRNYMHAISEMYERVCVGKLLYLNEKIKIIPVH
ncbi:MAG: UvrD-helicase domain-containing protein [Bacteroidales bacterium]|nr:UvrD-helicase domain-containing protein [Bacteroidales bacterium]